MRFRTALGLSFVVGCIGIMSSPSVARAQERVRVTASSANIRTAASTDARILGAAPRGTIFEVIGQVGDWYLVRIPQNLRIGASEGHVSVTTVEVLRSNDVAPAPPPAAPPRTTTTPPRARTAPQPREQKALPEKAFAQGVNYVGLRVGFPSVGNGIAPGASFERAISPVMGLGAFADYWSFSQSLVLGPVDYSYTSIGATAAYHYTMLEDKKLDPFAGLAVGYYLVSRNDQSGFCDLPGIDCSQYSSNKGFIGAFAGARYLFSSRIAGTARAGLGMAYLTVGIDARF